MFRVLSFYHVDIFFFFHKVTSVYTILLSVERYDMKAFYCRGVKEEPSLRWKCQSAFSHTVSISVPALLSTEGLL